MKNILASGAIVALLFVAGCGGDTETAEPAPQSPQTTAAPSPSATNGSQIVGDYADDEGRWGIHLGADGKFTMDIDGAENVRGGTYGVEGTKIVLTGGDGNTDRGTLKDGVLTLDFATLKRQ